MYTFHLIALATAKTTNRAGAQAITARQEIRKLLSKVLSAAGDCSLEHVFEGACQGRNCARAQTPYDSVMLAEHDADRNYGEQSKMGS